MADWDGRKSPLGCHWAVPLLPGSDTDFHAVRPGTGCFSLGKRMLFVREMDRLALVRVVHYSGTGTFGRSEFGCRGSGY